MIRLAGYNVRAYLPIMKGIYPHILGISLLCVSCEKDSSPVEVDETRQTTTKDRKTKLFATSDERFRNAQPSPVKGSPPENWLVLPPAQFRELNYRFGASGTGEVYVSLASGEVAANVNRWRGQFSLAPFTLDELDAAEKTPIAGTEGIWILATGEYASGMGAPAKPGYGLAGVIAQVGGKIVTLKMVGLEAEVEAEKAALKTFAASLYMVR